MGGLSRKEIKESVLNTTRQESSQIGNLVNEYINLTISEINDPAWAMPKGNYSHLWSFLRRKTSFSVSAETYVLPREVDKIGLMRQEDTPAMLTQLTDEKFYEYVPKPDAEGNPLYYRLWEMEGVATRLTTADTIDVVSDSTSDSGSAALSVSVSGFSSGIWRTETYQLNGTTAVTGSITFDADKVIYVQKQQDTTGIITVTENSGGTTLVTVGPNERAPKFKVVSFYPIPSSNTIYLEFYTRIPMLNNDSDVPMFDEKWHYIVRLGTIAKVYEYLNKEATYVLAHNMYSKAVQSMVASDRSEPNLLVTMGRRYKSPLIKVYRSQDDIV